tara:strand:+ start:3482 stop:3700 length:219 start_codon:yes stop_codon:yes gene_type:complete
MMNVCEYFSSIPYQLLANVGIPSNYYALDIDQQFLFEHLLKEHARLLKENTLYQRELHSCHECIEELEQETE